MALEWDALDHKWRSGGKALTAMQKAEIRNDIAAQYQRYIQHETDLFRAGKLEYDSWVKNVDDYIMKATGNGYTFGRGGIAQMTDRDYDKLARLLDRQSSAFRAFADRVLNREAEEWTWEQITAWTKSYGGSAIEAYEQGQQSAVMNGTDDWDWELPFYPGDGETVCKNQCRCVWEIEEDEYGVTCTYHSISDRNRCSTCTARGRDYGPGSPLVIDKPGMVRQLEIGGMAA